MMIPAFALGASDIVGKTYYIFIDKTIYWLNFYADDVVLTVDGIDTVFPYFYEEPLGELALIPFYIIDDTLHLVTDEITLQQLIIKPEPEPEPEPNDPIDLNKVKWLHTDVSDWAVTAKLNAIKIGSSTITVDYDKACVWPGESADGGEPVNANPWVFVNLDGTWYGATWEWMKVCQTVKNLYAVDGSHIKVPPLDTWHPVSGETYYFMVSGLARSTQRNVLERSNLLKVIWP
jgi:hypothetical protein